MMVSGTTVENGKLIPKGGSWLVEVNNNPGQGWGGLTGPGVRPARHSPMKIPTPTICR